MADNEIILTFEITGATNNITRLENELKRVKKEYKNAEIGSKEFYKAQEAGKQLTSEITKQTNALKANTNALNGVNQSAKFGENSYGALKQSIKTTKDELLKLDITSDKFTETQKELADLELKRIGIEKQMPSLFKERIKGAIDESNALKDLRAQIKAAQSAALGGDKEAVKSLAELRDKLEDVQDATKALKGTGIEKLNASMGLLTESFANLDADKLKAGLAGIGSAMKAIPIFLVIEGLKLLIENFDKVFAFFQGFTDEAQQVKKLELAFVGLQRVLEKQKTALEGSIQIQEATIELDKVKGASNADILIQEEKLYQTKIQLIKVKAVELKADIQIQAAKAAEIQANDDLYESGLRLIANATKSEDVERLIQASKFKRSEETRKKFDEDIKALSELNTDLTTLQINQETKVTQNKIDEGNKRRESSREIRQAEIENIKEDYKRTVAQIEFDKQNQLEDLKRDRDFRGDKAKLKKEIEDKAAKETFEAAKVEAIRLEQIENDLQQKKIDIIRSSFERQQKQLALDEKVALQNAENTIKNVEELEETKQAIIAKYAEENRKINVEYVTKDMEAQAELNVLQAATYEEQFQARQEQLESQKQIELENLELTESERLLILEKYQKQEEQMDLERLEQKRAIRDSEIEITQQAANALINIGQLLSDSESEIANLARIASLINIAANTATAISGLLAVSFSPTQPDNLVNPFAPYLKIAAGIGVITANAVQAKQVLNSFEDGGYTGDGPSNEVSTNLGKKNYTYHKNEYVIPSRVLNTTTGLMLASRAESMRLGMSNPMPYIGGMFDGGFTARSAGSNAASQISTKQMMQSFIAQLPEPVVLVSEIDKVKANKQQAIQVSGI
jgi:hypothetical protein